MTSDPYCRYGEAASIKITDEARDKINAIKAVVKTYHPEDMFNMDETDLFYRLEPNRVLATRHLSGKKKNVSQLPVFQPMDCGIIRCFKAHYRRQLIELKLDKINQHQNPKIDDYEAVLMMERAWRINVSAKTIRKWWSHSQLVTLEEILPDFNDPSIPDLNAPASDEIEELTSTLQRLGEASIAVEDQMPTISMVEYIDYENVTPKKLKNSLLKICKTLSSKILDQSLMIMLKIP
ncbi:hypothetical protein R1sor_006441 [Riccia sorocarpa]|uniref:DDE-1 domain-containing protein n=1 Tax=Riccia sorocarpa TaxID=122646 RepID=A0ABD3HMH5_9MARC